MSVTISADLFTAAKKSPSFPKDWDDAMIRRELARYGKFLLLAQRHPGQPPGHPWPGVTVNAARGPLGVMLGGQIYGRRLRALKERAFGLRMA